MHGAADILHGAAIILCGIASSILSNVPDILHGQHQFFEREKFTFFQKCSKIGIVSCQKTDYHFLGGGDGQTMVY